MAKLPKLFEPLIEIKINKYRLKEREEGGEEGQDASEAESARG